MEEKNPIDYYKEAKAFVAHLPVGKCAEFKNNGNSLYYYKATEKYKKFIAESNRVAGVTEEQEPKKEDFAIFSRMENTQASKPIEVHDVIADEKLGECKLVQRKKKARNKLVQRK